MATPDSRLDSAEVQFFNMDSGANPRSIDLILETWMVCDPDGISVERSNVYNCFPFLA